MQTWQEEAQLSAALMQSEHYRGDAIPLALRQRYPELRKFFDAYEDRGDYLEGMVERSELDFANGEAQDLRDQLDEAAERFAQIRDMCETLAKLDAAADVEGEILDLANKADAGYERCKV